MQHLFWFYYFTEEENTLLLSCNSTAKPSASLVLLKKNIQLYFLVNFPTANPTEMMKIMQTQHAFELFCPQNIIRKETIKQQSINQSATSTLTMKLTTAAPTVLFSFIVASTMMEPSLSEKILMRENANEKTTARLLGGNGGSGPSSDCEKNDPKHCVGDDACTGADLDDVKENDTCNGDHACYNISDSSVDRNSCNHINACIGLEEMKIGKNACNEWEACANATSNIIGDDACSGRYACNLAANNHIGDDACVFDYACEYAESNKIRRNACYGYQSCQLSKQNVIGAYSCTRGDLACHSLQHSIINKRSCLGTQACFEASYIDTCKWSCFGGKACSLINRDIGSPDHRLKIGTTSCRGDFSCYALDNVSSIGTASCISIFACTNVNGNNGTIPAATIGENSCFGNLACRGYFGPRIGDNACVGYGICANCGIAVEDGQCNKNIAGSICNCPPFVEPSIEIQFQEPVRISPDDSKLLY